MLGKKVVVFRLGPLGYVSPRSLTYSFYFSCLLPFLEFLRFGMTGSVVTPI